MTTTSAPVSIDAAVQAFLNRTHELLVDGQWVDAADGRRFETINPADESELCKVARGGEQDVDRAVAAARRAFESGPWRWMSSHERGRLLYRLADLIEEHAEEFAQLETLDNGKPLTVARAADVKLVIEHIRYYAGWADKIEGETIPVAPPYAPGQRFLNYTLREPIGVVGQIIPWNFPLLMAAWKIGAALASGCCIVLKPAEQTPLSALRLAELWCELDPPPGVFNVVTGFGDAGAALAAHPDVDKVAFTGSTEVGREIVKASAGNLKKVTLELGGKSPNIVFADSDLEAAAQGAAAAIFFNHGQCCCAGSRLFVESKVHEEITERVIDIGRSIKLGPGMAPDTQMGPLVSREQYERVRGYIDAGRHEGATVRAGTQRTDAGLERGFFVEPTVMSDVHDEMKPVCEEIFGPVLATIPFSEPEELVARANATEYGLAAGIWTRDIRKAHRTAELVKAGTVWINCYNMFDAASPFGGYKQSGYGREMGKHALENYTQVKSVWVQT